MAVTIITSKEGRRWMSIRCTSMLTLTLKCQLNTPTICLTLTSSQFVKQIKTLDLHHKPRTRYFFSYELFVPGARLEFIDGINVNLTHKIKWHKVSWRYWWGSNPRYAACGISDNILLAHWAMRDSPKSLGCFGFIILCVSHGLVKWSCAHAPRTMIMCACARDKKFVGGKKSRPGHLHTTLHRRRYNYRRCQSDLFLQMLFRRSCDMSDSNYWWFICLYFKKYEILGTMFSIIRKDAE